MSASRKSPGGHWLFKADPDAFSFDDLSRAPGATTSWDGIRNAEARNLMRDRIRALEKKGRLSVQPVTAAEWKAVLALATHEGLRATRL